MLKHLRERGLECEDSLLDNFERAFSDEILYLGINESIENKARQINAIKREDLFEYDLQTALFMGQPNIIKVIS